MLYKCNTSKKFPVYYYGTNRNSLLVCVCLMLIIYDIFPLNFSVHTSNILTAKKLTQAT